MGGYGFVFLEQLFNELKQQSCQDFEIVISDQSTDNKVLEICQKYSSIHDIKYFKNFYNRGKAAVNTNKAMKYASGEIIKILHQDDFFVKADALSKIHEEFKKGAKWTVNGFTHCSPDKKHFFNTKIPFYQDGVLLGENTIGNPSNLSILAKEYIYMDESILYVVDCEFYYRIKQKLGLPVIIQDILVCARHHPISTVDNPEFIKLKESEVKYCLKKHNLRVLPISRL